MKPRGYLNYCGQDCRGIKILMKKGDKLYKQMIEGKDKQKKFIKHESCKKYQKKILELLWIH